MSIYGKGMWTSVTHFKVTHQKSPGKNEHAMRNLNQDIQQFG